MKKKELFATNRKMVSEKRHNRRQHAVEPEHGIITRMY